MRALMRGANAGMLQVAAKQAVSANEVWTAYFTLAKAALQAAKDSGVPVGQLQHVVQQLWLEAADTEDVQ